MPAQTIQTGNTKWVIEHDTTTDEAVLRFLESIEISLDTDGIDELILALREAKTVIFRNQKVARREELKRELQQLNQELGYDEEAENASQIQAHSHVPRGG